MKGYIYVAQGDLTRLAADAVAFSSSSSFKPTGHLYSAFRAHIPGFDAGFQSLSAKAGAGQPGDTHWYALPPGSKPQGVVVVVAAGEQLDGAEQAYQAVRAAIETAVRELRQAGREDRLLLALPAFRAGREADRQAVQESARAEVRAAVEALDGLPGVDVVFMTYTPTLYQAFLKARRDILAETQTDNPPPPEELVQALEAGECVLFVGAGLSHAAGLPGWAQLVRQLAEQLQIEWHDRLDYLDVSQWYRERFGPEALAKIIRQTFERDQLLPTLAHYLLLALPCRYVVTTNYDQLIEEALIDLKRQPVPIIRQEDVPRTGGRAGVYVIKLHGDVGCPQELVLCRDDFDAFFQDRPALASLLEGLLLNQTFFFVGYGLRDPNFRLIFNRIAQILQGAKRPAFATTFEAGDMEEYLARQWQGKQLTLIPIHGPDRPEQEQQFIRWLDQLAERVALQAPRAFLAPDMDLSPRLQELCRDLDERIGQNLTKMITEGTFEKEEVEHLTAVLRFLTRHGWRPEEDVPLCTLWARLAAGYEHPARKRELLIEALATAERFEDVQRLRKQLDDESAA